MQTARQVSQSGSIRKVKILSLKFAKSVRRKGATPVSVYAVVQSVSRPNKLNHNVTKSGRKFACTCEGNSLGGNICRHIRRVRERLARRSA